MKHLSIKIVIIFFTINMSYGQQWMTSLEFAEKLALIQNKMILMVWEDTTKYDYPILVNDDKGRTLVISNLFTDEDLSPLIWKNFVPVIVSENQYADLYLPIKGKRSQRYIDKFNDNTIKIMDVNGNIINISSNLDTLENISELIEKYALNTEFINSELKNYRDKKTFYTTYFLASKYLDMSLYTNKRVRPQIIDLSNIYLEEAKQFLESGIEKNKPELNQICELLKIQEFLVLEKPKRALRILKKMEADKIEGANEPFVAFLYYTAHKILRNETEAETWKNKVSSVNLRKAQMIINLN